MSNIADRSAVIHEMSDIGYSEKREIPKFLPQYRTYYLSVAHEYPFILEFLSAGRFVLVQPVSKQVTIIAIIHI